MSSSASFLPTLPWRNPISRKHPPFTDPHSPTLHPPVAPPTSITLNSLHHSPFPLSPDSSESDHKFPTSFSHSKTLDYPIFHDPIHFQHDLANLPWLPSLGDNLEKIFLEEPPCIPHSASSETRKRYNALRRRQVKAETAAWERAAEEYKELERVMLEKKLAPSLPYVKSLFLGWFEPLRGAIERDQKVQKGKRHRAAYAHHMSLLPADKMAVIVMHKMMGLLMMGQEEGCVRVVQAAIHVGEAVEHEVIDG